MITRSVQIEVRNTATEHAYTGAVDVRERLLDAAEAQLNASPHQDVAVRAVCEAAGVGAPVLYRVFGDKNGLLEALVNRGFERYLSGKRSAPASDDPVQDLRAGWDSHVAFAVANPAVYRMLYSPTFATVPSAAAEALELLEKVLERCALAHRLRVDPDLAAQAIMATNVGVALSMITQPKAYTDAALSDRVRDAVHAAVLVPAEPAADGPSPAEGGASAKPGEELRRTAVSIGAHLRAAPSSALTAEEAALLQQWLAQLAART